MRPAIIIIGAGGHAAVLADALLCADEHVLGFTDTDESRIGRMLCGLPVLGSDDVLDDYAVDALRLVNGLGGVRIADLMARQRLQEQLTSRGWRFVGVRHPVSVVSRFATVSTSAQVLAGSVVQAGAILSDGCIVNSAAIIEHDVQVGGWTHVAPGATICGGVIVGEMCLIGAGAVVRQCVRVARQTLVGAGAVVVREFDPGAAIVGVPAQQARPRK